MVNKVTPNDTNSVEVAKMLNAETSKASGWVRGIIDGTQQAAQQAGEATKAKKLNDQQMKSYIDSSLDQANKLNAENKAGQQIKLNSTTKEKSGIIIGEHRKPGMGRS